MVIDHVCVAVPNLKDSIEYWERVFGYNQMTSVVENSIQKVLVVFLKKEGSMMVKLIEPTKDNISLQNFIKRGGSLHHLCFKCDNLTQTMSEMSDKGLLTLVSPQPGEAFNNHDIAFLLAKNGLNIEIIDTDEKAGIL